MKYETRLKVSVSKKTYKVVPASTTVTLRMICFSLMKIFCLAQLHKSVKSFSNLRYFTFLSASWSADAIRMSSLLKHVCSFVNLGFVCSFIGLFIRIFLRLI
jgi:hypothetical protein